MFRPVLAGLWQHRDLLDDTFTFRDLLDAHELLDVRLENDRRINAWKAAQQKPHGS